MRRDYGPTLRRRGRSGLAIPGALPARSPRVLRRRHRRAWLVLAAIMLVIASGAVVWRFQRSDYFAVTDVEVTGARNADPHTIIAAAHVLGRQLYSIDPRTATKLVQRLPLVQSASVTRAWPHTVRISVRERMTWGTWQIGGMAYLVDPSGKVLDVASVPHAPVIYELDAAPGLQLGDRVDADAIKMADQVISELPGILSQQVNRLEYSADGGLEIITDRGERARLGDSQGLDYKLAVWRAVESKVGAGKVHVIDLRFPDRPAYD